MASKPQLARDSTMVATSKAGKEFLGDEKLGDTRLATQSKRTVRRSSMRKGQSIKRTIEEAKILLGSSADLADVNSARQLRKHPASIPLPAQRVNKKGAGRPSKKAKVRAPTGSTDAATPSATNNSASADGATAASA